MRAWEGFQYKKEWRELQQRGMVQDFSWDKSAVQYIDLYRGMLGAAADEPDLAIPAQPEPVRV